MQNTTAIQPTANHILLRVHIPREDKGIILPDGVIPETRNPYAEVLAVGPDVRDKRITPSARVLFLPNGGIGMDNSDPYHPIVLVTEGIVIAILADETVTLN